MDAAPPSELRTIIDAVLRGELDQEQATRMCQLGDEVVCAVVLAASQRFAELKGTPPGIGIPGANTPSGAIPPYAKPTVKKRRRRPGARLGHQGHHRPAPLRIDHREQVKPLVTCPHCSGAVKPAKRFRRRMIEDMPDDITLEATEYTIPRHWCPHCKKKVEPRVEQALPGATIGNRLTAMTTVFHYGLGLTIEQTREILLSPLQTKISPGGMVAIWQRVAKVFLPWYEQIGEEARHSATLHADETGWRVNGKTHWLWCFCNHRNCYYLIDRSRGSPALQKFFTEAFEGVLIHDFWAPYNSVLLEGEGDHQCCLVHLLRTLHDIDDRTLPHKSPAEAESWKQFVKPLKRLLRDGIRLRNRKDFTPEKYASRIHGFDQRLVALAEAEYVDPDAKRLAKRLRRHQNEIFTFLDYPEADWNNNFAERQIRPAVILRRNSQCNRSEPGAATQAVLMSIYRTLKLRGHDPRATIAQALTAYAATGKLPPLPPPSAAIG